LVEYKWEVVRTQTFLELFRSKDDVIKKKALQVIDDLAMADFPWRLGEKKYGDFLATELSKSERLAYSVDGKGKRVYLLKVCDHKEVYGKG